MIEAIAKRYKAYKYYEFKPNDKVFRFLNSADIDLSDPLEKFEAIGYFYGFLDSIKRS